MIKMIKTKVGQLYVGNTTESEEMLIIANPFIIGGSAFDLEKIVLSPVDYAIHKQFIEEITLDKRDVLYSVVASETIGDVYNKSITGIFRTEIETEVPTIEILDVVEETKALEKHKKDKKKQIEDEDAMIAQAQEIAQEIVEQEAIALEKKKAADKKDKKDK